MIEKWTLVLSPASALQIFLKRVFARPERPGALYRQALSASIFFMAGARLVRKSDRHGCWAEALSGMIERSCRRGQALSQP
jgi:hypothetical protein